MQYSDRLQTIKECDLVDVIITLAEGKPVNLKSVIDDVNWLIEQAEKVESLQKQLDAKIIFINNGWEEERYALQDEVERLENSNKALKKVILVDVEHQKRREKRKINI